MSPGSSGILLVALVAAIGTPLQANLLIHPTYDTSITGNANSAAIMGTIGTAISWYETTFADPITVDITFVAGTSGLGSTSFSLYLLTYQDFYNALLADATSPDDVTALARLAVDGTGVNNPVTGSPQVFIKAPNARALGLATSGGSDATITFNAALTTPGSPGSSGTYNLLPVIFHEIDEALGLGSTLGLNVQGSPSPEDFFRFDNSGGRSFTAGNSATSYFSIDGATLLAQFNQTGSGDYGDWASTATKRVQDAFATPGANPTPGVEIRALDVIGYDLATPEPGTLLLLATGLAGLALRRRLLN